MEKKPRLSTVTQMRHADETFSSQIVKRAPSSPLTSLIKELQSLQELSEHHAELELQNQEFQQTQLALEEALSRYVSLYEFSPVAYLSLTENGTIVEANLVSAELLQVDRSSLIKQRFSRFVDAESADIWHQHFHAVKQHGNNKSCELKIHRTDGTVFYGRLDCLLLNSNDPGLTTEKDLDNFTDSHVQSNYVQTNHDHNSHADLRIRMTLTDITEAKIIEQELRVAAMVFESHEAIIMTDSNNVILKVNNAFSKITGYSADEAVGNTPNLYSSGRHDAAFYASMWSQINSQDKWQGEVWNRFKNGVDVPCWLSVTAVHSEDGTVTHYLGSFHDITTRKMADEEMQLLAFYDGLTNLPNRRLFLDRMQRAMISSNRNRNYCALMLIDFDNFKCINDTLGHDVGDLMLQTVAQRLQVSVREGDTVARLGGDEFVVMLENLHEDVTAATAIAKKIGEQIITAINQPFQLAGNECKCSVSIGISLFLRKLNTPAEIQKQADLAMYEAKATGGNVLKIFTD
jgi:diguanylate cyclase (GGDEF)-like protein/PAS domain S-box-containing protein